MCRFFALIAIFAGPLFGQTADLRFRNLSVEHGLSSPRISCIHQDQTGYMWFGTRDGLNRYDGHEFLVFRPEPRDETEAVDSHTIHAIHEDGDGMFWIGTTSKGLYKFDPRTGRYLTNIRYDASEPDRLVYKSVSAIHGGAAGKLWIGTSWMGLQRFDPSTGEFEHFSLREPTEGNTSQGRISNLYSNGPDAKWLWVGTERLGLVRLDVSSGQFEFIRDRTAGSHAVDPPATVSFIGPDTSATLWVGGGNGILYRVEIESGRFVEAFPFDQSGDFRSGAVSSVLQDSGGRVWVSHGTAGLARFFPERGEFEYFRYDARNPDGLAHNFLSRLFQDRSGMIWVGTLQSGLSTFDPAGGWIRHYQFAGAAGTGPSPNPITCAYQEEDEKEIVWLGSADGLIKWNRKSGAQKYYRSDPSDATSLSANNIRNLKPRAKGGFWVGADNGLNYYDPVKDRIFREDAIKERIWVLHEDRFGDLWIGGRPTGVVRFNPESGDLRHYVNDPDDPHSIGPGWVTRFAEDAAGRLWLGHHVQGNGIEWFDHSTDRFVRYPYDHADPASPGDEVIGDLLLDNEDTFLWIGNRRGLEKISIAPGSTPSGFEKVDLGRPILRVEGLQQDAAGILWMATREGLLCLDPSTTPPTVMSTAPETRGQFPGLSESSLRLRSGEILFGARSGLYEIRPDQFEAGKPPPVVITKFEFGEEETSPQGLEGDPPILTYQQNKVLNFHFTALDYSAPNQRRYSWMLEGLDENWHAPTDANSATYTTLPAGKYVFRVKASNGRGTWNEEGASLAFRVLPPWWATWWFRAGAAATLLAAVVGLVSLRLRSMHQRTRELEEEAESRAKLNRELTRSDQRFQSFIANSSEQIWCLEFEEPIPLDLPEAEQAELILDRGVLVEINEAFAKNYGATVDEATGWRLEKILPRSLPSTIPIMLDVVRSGYRMEGLETVEESTDGAELIVLNNFIGTIEDGKVLRLWGTARDVTEQRKIEQQIVLRSTAIETMRDACIIVDAKSEDQPIVYMNDRFLEITGYSDSEVLGRNCRFLQGPESSRDTVAKIRESVAAGKPFNGEVLNYRKDGTPFWNFLRISPVQDKNRKVSHFVGVLSDVSKRKSLEADALEQRNQLSHVSRVSTMGELTAAFAHELNQPLAAILRNAQAARRFLSSEDPDLKRISVIMEDIVRDDKRAGEVLNRIRRLVTKNQGDHEQVEMNGLVQETLELVRSELLLKRVEVELKLADDLPMFQGDRVQLQQVIINLIVNASDAMKGSSIESPVIVVSTSLAEGSAVEVTVSDNGDGISEENLKKMFTPFFSTKAAGMGMGLAINKTIIDAHGGKIWAKNRREGGAQIGFSIPLGLGS